MKLFRFLLIFLFAGLTLSSCISSNKPSSISPTASPTKTQPPTQTSSKPALLSLFPACIDRSRVSQATVLDVLDGDTIVALVNGNKEHIRYIGIDAPEKDLSPDLAVQSAEANKRLLKSGDVTLYADQSNTDDYGRLLRYVFAGEIFVNRELVVLGLAEENSYPPDTACAFELLKAEGIARDANLGMWQFANQNLALGSPKIMEVNKVKEYLIIRNIGTGVLDLTGWVLASERGNQICSLHGRLEPGEDLIIFSQFGQGGFNCGLSEQMWNNNLSDPASLYNPDGDLVDRWEDN